MLESLWSTWKSTTFSFSLETYALRFTCYLVWGTSACLLSCFCGKLTCSFLWFESYVTGTVTCLVIFITTEAPISKVRDVNRDVKKLLLPPNRHSPAPDSGGQMWAPQPCQPVCSGCHLGRLCLASSSRDYDLKNIPKVTPFSLHTRGTRIHPTVPNIPHWETYHWETNSMCTNTKSNIHIYSHSHMIF